MLKITLAGFALFTSGLVRAAQTPPVTWLVDVSVTDQDTANPEKIRSTRTTVGFKEGQWQKLSGAVSADVVAVGVRYHRKTEQNAYLTLGRLVKAEGDQLSFEFLILDTTLPSQVRANPRVTTRADQKATMRQESANAVVELSLQPIRTIE
ncbi:MAG: hypothetical protein AAB425_04905 [Bdellovibrionota bacterium]